MSIPWSGALRIVTLILQMLRSFRERKAGEDHANLEHAKKENEIKAKQLEIAVNAPTDDDDLAKRVREQGW